MTIASGALTATKKTVLRSDFSNSVSSQQAAVVLEPDLLRIGVSRFHLVRLM